MHRKKCDESFAYFAAWQTDCGAEKKPDGTPIDFFDFCHIDVCIFLQYAGPCKELIIPRGFIKSHIGARLYPLWKTTKWLNNRTLIGGNSTRNARKRINEIRESIMRDDFKKVYPEMIPQSYYKTRWSDDCADINRPGKYSDGSFESSGLKKKITGQHKNLIVEDDTSCPDVDDLDSKGALPKPEDIEQAIGWHRSAVPLLVDPITDESLIITTRWCAYDLCDYIRKNEPHYRIFQRAAVNHKTGLPMYPKRFTIPVLEQIKFRIGTYLYNALYDNNPIPLDQMTFRPDWIEYFNWVIPKMDGFAVVTVDPIPPEESSPMGRDNAAIVACYHPTDPEWRGHIFVLKYYVGRCSVPEQIDKSIEMALQVQACRIRVEANFFAMDMMHRMRNKVAAEGIRNVVVEPIKYGGNEKRKTMRILGLVPIAENHLLHLRRGMSELENEMFGFLPGKRLQRDDLIDALAFQLEDYQGLSKTAEVKKERPSQNSFESIIAELKEKRGKANRRSYIKPQLRRHPYEVFN